MKLLFLLLLGLASLATAEVVQSFRSKCPQFFYSTPKKEVLPPTVLKGPQYKQICQRWKEEYRFATLYDTRKRIPVYSAYTFSGKEHHKRWKGEWMIEPQLDLGLKADRDMREMEPEEKDMIKNQAQSKDYSGKRYCSELVTRGHVFPNGYAASKEQAESTFTLTNVAPQTEKSNQEWADVEQNMLNEANECDRNGNQAYIVTGVVPGDTWIEIERNGRAITKGINIPSHFWVALTCTMNNGTRFSKAYLAQQINQFRSVCSEFRVTELGLDTLDDKLAKLYNTPLCVFKKCAEKKTM